MVARVPEAQFKPAIARTRRYDGFPDQLRVLASDGLETPSLQIAYN